ncbi:MAG: hypothetical protein Athens071424_77 [Parcubacteria group bacterium Athens0714_24]|nr:MAG: hypothetical protein Athens071424_77 [Parcubacteria group bacterium Athens0714_24]
MIIKEIKYNETAEHLNRTNLISVSEEHIDFCRNYWGAEPVCLGFFNNNNVLSAVLVLLRWQENGLIYLGASLKSYTEIIFLKDIDIDFKKIIDFIKKNFAFDILDLSICPIINNNQYLPKSNWFTATYILKTNNSASPDDLLRAMDGKTRNQIKKSQEYNLNKENCQDVEKFYPIYCDTIERLGARPKSRKYFGDLKNYFGRNFYIIFAEKDRQAIGANLFVIKGNYLALLFNASKKDFWRYNINDFLYWETIRFGLSQGVAFFDFGLNAKRDKKQIHFKAGFGARAFPIYHSVTLNSLRAFFTIYKNKLIFLSKLLIKK